MSLLTTRQPTPLEGLSLLTILRPSFAAAAAKSLQSCPTQCDPVDGSLPGYSLLGILQVRTLEWVAISFSNAWKWKVKVKWLSCVWLFATPCIIQSLELSRPEYWSGYQIRKETINKQTKEEPGGAKRLRIWQTLSLFICRFSYISILNNTPAHCPWSGLDLKDQKGYNGGGSPLPQKSPSSFFVD